MMRATFALWLLLGASGCTGTFRAEARGERVMAADGYPLRAYRMVAEDDGVRPKDATVFYLDGSRRTSVLERMGALAGFSMMGFPVILVEPRGLRDDGSLDREVARRSDTKQLRASDQHAVIDAMLGRVPTEHVVLVGASEGGDVAARVAAEDPRVTHVLLLGSGGGLTQADELRSLVRKRPGAFGLADLPELERGFARVKAEPDALTEWLGHPYRRWSSYLWSRPLDDLARSRASVLLLQGAADENVPVESARALAGALGRSSRFSYVEYAGVDHRFRHGPSGRAAFPCLEVDAVHWLARTGLLDAEEERRFAERTRAQHPEWFAAGNERCGL